MSCVTLSEVKWRTYQHARSTRWGADATLKFEDKNKATILTVRDGWMARRVQDEITGVSQMEVSVLYQVGILESLLRTVWFVVIAGRRYEKRAYEPLPEIPSQHKFRFDNIGEAV